MKKWLIVNKKDLSSSKVIETSLALVDSKASKEGWTDFLRTERLVLFSKYWMELKREE